MENKITLNKYFAHNVLPKQITSAAKIFHTKLVSEDKEYLLNTFNKFLKDLAATNKFAEAQRYLDGLEDVFFMNAEGNYKFLIIRMHYAKHIGDCFNIAIVFNDKQISKLLTIELIEDAAEVLMEGALKDVAAICEWTSDGKHLVKEKFTPLDANIAEMYLINYINTLK